MQKAYKHYVFENELGRANALTKSNFNNLALAKCLQQILKRVRIDSNHGDKALMIPASIPIMHADFDGSIRANTIRALQSKFRKERKRRRNRAFFFLAAFFSRLLAVIVGHVFLG
jgi:hypothetical protein